MTLKSIIIFAALGAALFFWNLRELPDFRVDASRVRNISPAASSDLPQLDWLWFDQVKVVTREGACTLVLLPPELEALDGKVVTVSGPSFACGEDLVERGDGYAITGFILVPYFGMIDCCIGNPVPYFQWTVVVKKLAVPWEINHKGIIDPDVVVRGRLHIERAPSREGLFFLEDARVIHSADADKREN